MREPGGDDCTNRKTNWTTLGVLAGDPKRIALVAPIWWRANVE